MNGKQLLAEQDSQLRHQEDAARNERFVGECLQKIRTVPDAEEGLHQLLKFLGESLQCDRVYVFEEMDRLHIRNTYEWCHSKIPSGIEQLPYVTKKDLTPWYERLSEGENIVLPDVKKLQWSNPLLYEFLVPQQIYSIVLSPLLSQGQMYGFLGADNPPPEMLSHISVLFDVLAYFVCSLLSQRELARLRGLRANWQNPKENTLPHHIGKIVLLVDDSHELLLLNKRILHPAGYKILCASSLQEARRQLKETRPDVIVMDIDLPDGNGLSFCKELRRTTDIPVVFLTAHSDTQTAKESELVGGYAFLTKPYQLEELQTAVSDAVSCKSKHNNTSQKILCNLHQEGS